MTMDDDGFTWVKSSLSNSFANCVQVAALPSGMAVLVRHSRRAEPVIAFTPGEWAAFVGGVKAGEFDHLTGPEGTG
jgi:Domain of unknown function (DUF397)